MGMGPKVRLEWLYFKDENKEKIVNLTNFSQPFHIFHFELRPPAQHLSEDISFPDNGRVAATFCLISGLRPWFINTRRRYGSAKSEQNFRSF